MKVSSVDNDINKENVINIPCRAFILKGSCNFGLDCKFVHCSKENEDNYLDLYSWRIAGFPKETSALVVLQATFSALFGTESTSLTVKDHLYIEMRTRGETAMAFLSLKYSNLSSTINDLNFIEGVMIDDIACTVERAKTCREQRQERQLKLDKAEAAIQERKAKEKAIKLAKEQVWSWKLLSRFPCRYSTLDQHTQVTDLSPDLFFLIEKRYLPFRFPEDASFLTSVIKHIVKHNPLSLRVKELFETLETFYLLVKQISLSVQKFEYIFDFACGHGLLGVLLAYRFPNIQVVCVDLKARPAFEHYLAAFKETSISESLASSLSSSLSSSSSSSLSSSSLSTTTTTTTTTTSPISITTTTPPTSTPKFKTTSTFERTHQDKDHVYHKFENITMVEDDISNIDIPKDSFITCVHACNEANDIAISRAINANAGFSAMPCCIRKGLYGIKSVTHTDNDDVRYALLVGIVSGKYNAHTICGIDRKITNRNLFLFGGYESKKS